MYAGGMGGGSKATTPGGGMDKYSLPPELSG